MNTEVVEPTDFESNFDPQKYLEQRYKQPGSPENKLRDFQIDSVHAFFAELYHSITLPGKKSCKILDYGCGPVIAFGISAAGKAQVSEIVLAEYTPKSREAIQQWLDKDALAFNWSPYFNYVVRNLEGKSEQDVVSREERLRSLIKMASCDITLDQPIEKGYEGPYDVVLTMLAIESVCRSEGEYCIFIKRLSSLVEPGGHLLLIAKLAPLSQPMYYKVGNEDMYYYALSCDAVTNALKQASFVNISTTRLSIAEIIEGVKTSESSSIDTHWNNDSFYYMFFNATKVGPRDF